MEPDTATDAELLSDVTGSYDRLTEEELKNLGIVLGAVRMLRGNRRRHLAYVSMPITSGKRYFDVLTEHGVKSVEDLSAKCGKDALYNLVIKPNIEEGVAHADKLGTQKQELLFIAPSVFEAKKWRWSQDAYMALWYRVLGEMVGHHYMMPGWEYSTGGVKEVLFSVFMQYSVIQVRTSEDLAEFFGLKDFHAGLTREQAEQELQEMRKIRIISPSAFDVTNYALDWSIEKVTSAILDLRKRGLPYGDLLDLAWKLKMTWERGEKPSFIDYDAFNSPILQECFRHLEAIRKEDEWNRMLEKNR